MLLIFYLAVILSNSCMHARLILLLLSYPSVLKDKILRTIINTKNYKGMHMKGSTLRAEEPPSLGAAYGPEQLHDAMKKDVHNK